MFCVKKFAVNIKFVWAMLKWAVGWGGFIFRGVYNGSYPEDVNFIF